MDISVGKHIVHFKYFFVTFTKQRRNFGIVILVLERFASEWRLLPRFILWQLKHTQIQFSPVLLQYARPKYN